MLNGNDLQGIIVPVVTPVTEDDRVDLRGLARVVEHVLAGGVHGVFVMGSTGNFTSFSPDERLEIARTVVQQVRGRVPVLVGCSDANTRTVLNHVRNAFEAGGDAIVLEPPFLFPCTDDDVLRHYRAVADRSALPIVIYNNPGDTKVNIHYGLTEKLAEHSRIIGIKDSSFDFVNFQALVRTFTGTRFAVLQGLEGLLGASFLIHAQGAILAMGNVVPRLCVRIYEAGRAGKIQETLELQKQLISLYEVLKYYGDDPQLSAFVGKETVSSFFGGLQCALDALGVCKQLVTLPYLPPSPNDYQRIRQILSNFPM